jgi:hypothetical protein
MLLTRPALIPQIRGVAACGVAVTYAILSAVVLFRKRAEMPYPEVALPGRETPMRVPTAHLVLGTPLSPPFPKDTEQAIFGLGCFWGADRPL